jgi:dTDP-4-amino-4,6-dideoxygalactose transaminase
MIRMKIPLSAPDVSLAEEEAVAEVLCSSRLSLGPKLALGDAGVFAFYPNKQITAGEGGMIVTRDSVIAKNAHPDAQCISERR